MPDSRPQLAGVRSTEGSRAGQKRPGSASAQGPKKPRGRPPGSPNRPKSLLPANVADQILLQMKDMLPREHFDYMKGVIKDGKAISTKTELDALILLLSRNLYPALVMEQVTVEEGDKGDDFFKEDEDDGRSTAEQVVDKKLKMPVFRKDVTERLKVLQGLLSLRNQVEKRDADDATDGKEQVLRIVAGRGIDTDRLRVLVGIESGSVAGNSDGVGRPDQARTVSDQVPERQELLPSSVEGEADWVLDGDSGRGPVHVGDETEVHG